VYVANGSGSGTWTAHSTFSGVFGNRLLQLREQKVSGQDAASRTNGAWTKHTLDIASVSGEISGASLSNSIISLPSGTYWCDGYVVFYFSGNNAIGRGTARLRNTTAGTTLVNGSQFLASASASTSSNITQTQMSGRFTLGSTSNLELQYYQTGCLTPANFSAAGENNIYAELNIWKLS